MKNSVLCKATGFALSPFAMSLSMAQTTTEPLKEPPKQPTKAVSVQPAVVVIGTRFSTLTPHSRP
jgi:hypothetical protein